MGHYYVVSVAGSYGGIDYGVGDWCISDGNTWGKVDNTDAVVSFNGRIGAILPIASDYSAHYLGLHAAADDSARLGGQLPSYYESAIGNPSVSGYLLSSTTEGVRSWVAPYSHPATHAQSVIDSSTGWITDALAGTQPSGNYAGSATPGGAANSAVKLETARTLTIGATDKAFDGSTNVSFSLSEIGAVSINETKLGTVGNVPLDSVTNTAAKWSALPVGYACIFNVSIGTDGGLPSGHYYYVTKIANGDVAGKYLVLAKMVGGNEIYYGEGKSTELPTWKRVLTASDLPISGTWTLGLSADTPPDGVVLQYVHSSFTKISDLCFFTFGFQIKNVGTEGSGRIKITGLPYTSTSDYTSFGRPQVAVNHSGGVQLYQVLPSVKYIYATSGVPLYQTLTNGMFLAGQGFYKVK